MKYFKLMMSGLKVLLRAVRVGFDFNHPLYGTEPATLAPVVER